LWLGSSSQLHQNSYSKKKSKVPPMTYSYIDRTEVPCTYNKNGLGGQRVPQFSNYALLQLAINASFPMLNFCNPQLYDCINLELADKESPRLSTYVRVLGSSLLTLTSTQHTPPKTNHDSHLCPLLRFCLQVNRGQVVTPNLMILEKRSRSTILLLANALLFQMAYQR
jgi:hypothetical protein